MGKERVIFSNRFDRPTLEQIEEEMKKENYDDNENLRKEPSQGRF